jgi:hypothetical protein
MKLHLRSLSIVALLTSMTASLWAQSQATPAAGPPAPRVNPITGASPDPKWEEEYAYSLGVQAYVYAFPWVYNSLLRWRWSTQGLSDIEPATALPNRLSHQRKLTDASYRDGGRPNTDTLYSAAWADLRKEPLVLTMPHFGKRYYNVQLVGFDSDNFDYIGSRSTGQQGGSYALVGPDWKGTLPEGVRAVKPAHTPWILVLIRILVEEGDAELREVRQLQDQIRLQPLSEFMGKTAPATPAPYVAPPPLRRDVDPLADWKMINRALTESPPPPREAQLVKMFSQIGIGPGQNVDKVNDAVKRGLVRASATARMIVTSSPFYQAGRQFVDGWGMTPSNWGRPGVDGDYLVRGAKSFGGFVTHDPEENVYPAVLMDRDGKPLSDANKYVLRFPKGQTPPVNAFWSVTMYDQTFNFIDNAINRYAVGDRTTSLKFDADGSLPIYIQKDRPSDDKVGNWLPSGAGNFHLVLRAYWPKADIIDGKWLPPGVQRVE